MKYLNQILFLIFTFAVCVSQAAVIDVKSYSAQIEPVIADSSIQGTVTIKFSVIQSDSGNVEFACGELKVDSAFNNDQLILMRQKKNKLVVGINELFAKDSIFEIRFYYHGNPISGINFFPVLMQTYTVYSTFGWMISNPDLIDKADFELKLIVPPNLQSVGTGNLISSELLVNGKKLELWKTTMPVPAYTFGFSIGHFNSYREEYKGVSLLFYSALHTEKELSQIFSETGRMIDFFTEKSGRTFPGNQYSQIIAAGNVSQEMNGFSVLWEGYGKQVLGDSVQCNLGAHELAHQWWGNSITCADFRHFWLNEGLAVFMSSAYKEKRFGRKEYLKDIEFYCTKYQSVPDKPLVFPNWNNPVREDRIIVYFKGAYVFHLLKEQLGDDAFWAGIRLYSQKHFGGTAVSSDLQNAMEEASGKDLNLFFRKWVY